jgi:hypothetical protein
VGILQKVSFDGISNKLSFLFRNAKSIVIDPAAILPVGTIIPYAGPSIPQGFLTCDGSSQLIADYPNLFGVISTMYNTQIDPTTGNPWAAPSNNQFRVPDCRGVFLRGVGTPSGLDSVSLGGYQAQKTAKNGLTNSTSTATGTVTTSGSTLGAGGHTHIITWYGNGGAVQGTGTAGGDMSNPLGGSSSTGISLEGNHSHTLTLSSSFSGGSAAAQTVTGDNETRPINKGVNYIIKF